MYEAQIRYREDDWAPDAVFLTLDECVEHIERTATGRGLCPSVWINGKKVLFRNGVVLGQDGQRLCTNPYWHAIFAKEQERIPPVSERTLNSHMVQLARMRHDHARPTNPATLIGRGELEA